MPPPIPATRRSMQAVSTTKLQIDLVDHKTVANKKCLKQLLLFGNLAIQLVWKWKFVNSPKMDQKINCDSIIISDSNFTRIYNVSYIYCINTYILK